MAQAIGEVIGEKTRAAAQRSRVCDLYALYQLANQPYDRARVRRIAILKCWETRYAFDPIAFLDSLSERKYDWFDLDRLVRRDRLTKRFAGQAGDPLWVMVDDPDGCISLMASQFLAETGDRQQKGVSSL